MNAATATARYWVFAASMALAHGRHSDPADLLVTARGLADVVEAEGFAEIRMLATALAAWRRETDPERAGRWRAVVVALRDLALTSSHTVDTPESGQ
jgi:hypothetical protein